MTVDGFPFPMWPEKNLATAEMQRRASWDSRCKTSSRNADSFMLYVFIIDESLRVASLIPSLDNFPSRISFFPFPVACRSPRTLLQSTSCQSMGVSPILKVGREEK